MGLRVERKENRVQPSPEDPSPGSLSKTRTVENKQLLGGGKTRGPGLCCQDVKDSMDRSVR